MRFTNFLLAAAAAGALTTYAFTAANKVEAAGLSTPAATAAQDGKTFTHEGAGVTFELPAGWKAEPDGEQLTVSPAGGGVALVFWVTEEEDFDAAAKALGEELAKQIQDLKFDGEPKADKHNGMDHSAVTGTGKIGGKEVHFSADILAAKKPLIILTVGTAADLEKYAADYSKLVKSIKKVG